MRKVEALDILPRHGDLKDMVNLVILEHLSEFTIDQQFGLNMSEKLLEMIAEFMADEEDDEQD